LPTLDSAAARTPTLINVNDLAQRAAPRAARLKERDARSPPARRPSRPSCTPTITGRRKCRVHRSRFGRKVLAATPSSSIRRARGERNNVRFSQITDKLPQHG